MRDKLHTLLVAFRVGIGVATTLMLQFENWGFSFKLYYRSPLFKVQRPFFLFRRTVHTFIFMLTSLQRLPLTAGNAHYKIKSVLAAK